MPPIRVLVVDDSSVIRRLVTALLSEDPDIEVVGFAVNGKRALEKVRELEPDAVTLDVEMPEMDGVTTVRHLRKTHPRLPVVMFSTLTERGASATLDALSAGASDYVTKPANVGSVAESMDHIRHQLIPKIKGLCAARRRDQISRERAATSTDRRPATQVEPIPTPRAGTTPTGPISVLAIASSTGGPDALSAIIPLLPADFPVPVVIVQHMPPVFTKLFAQRLDSKSNLTVCEAAGGESIRAGHVYVAPGDRHMVVAGTAGAYRTKLTDAPQENFCRPAADVLFRSVAASFGGSTLAMVLTGMGHDGTAGVEQIAAAGGRVIVQDEQSSVVWGMPGAVVRAGIPAQQYPLDKLAANILRIIAGASAARPSSRTTARESGVRMRAGRET
jgi:two-component system chemotaxis response regulator CheB